MKSGFVTILGRPNVGKSTFFNKVCGKRISIVDDIAGVTRDRIYGETDWCGRKLVCQHSFACCNPSCSDNCFQKKNCFPNKTPFFTSVKMPCCCHTLHMFNCNRFVAAS